MSWVVNVHRNKSYHHANVIRQTNVSYFNEGVFKSVLDNKLNTINIFNETSLFDCEDCRNYWLIQENKQNQVKFPICKHNKTQTLFDYTVARRPVLGGIVQPSIGKN